MGLANESSPPSSSHIWKLDLSLHQLGSPSWSRCGSMPNAGPRNPGGFVLKGHVNLDRPDRGSISAFRRGRDVFAETAMSPRCLCRIHDVAVFAVRDHPCLVPRRGYLRAVVSGDDALLGAADSQSASDQILGVSVVPCNVCWQLKPFASLVHSAFVPVAGVPPP